MVLHLRSPGPGRVRDLPVVLFGPVDGFWQSVGARLEPVIWTKLACISTIFIFIPSCSDIGCDAGLGFPVYRDDWFIC